MTPDMVPNCSRQLMKEAMILAAPLLIEPCAELPLESGADSCQPPGAVADLGSASGRDRHDFAGCHALVSGEAGRLHALLMTDFPPLPG